MLTSSISISRLARCGWQVAVTLLFLALASSVRAQGLGGAGTVQGIVKDPTGGEVEAGPRGDRNPAFGLSRTAPPLTAGKLVFSNLAPNPYHVTVEAQGFQTLERDVDVRTGVPITLDLTLSLAGTTTAVEVVGRAGDLLERDPTAHTDITRA